MANHVFTNVTFDVLSDAGKAKLQEIYARVRPDESSSWFGDIFVDGKDGSPTYEETGVHGFYLEHIGPKWCYFEDMEDDYFSTNSAWSWPYDGVPKIFNEIAEVDPNFVASLSYDDEAYNFMGAAVYSADGCEYEEELDNEDIMELMIADVPELAEEYNEEDEELTDEGWDIFHENIGEVIHSHFSEQMASIMEDLKNNV